MCEKSRIEFIINRDGVREAIDWVQQTLISYEQSSMIMDGLDGRKFCFASSRDYKEKYLESMMSFMDFLDSQKISTYANI